MLRSSKVSTDHKSRSKTTRGRKARNKAKRQRRQLTASMEALEPRHLLAFSSALLGDINQFGVSPLIDTMIEYNNQALFVADDGQTGAELWISDGTEGGTVQVADILPGQDGSQPSNLTIVGSEVFFTALDADDEFDLWKTDGTTLGTVKVFDADANGVYYPNHLTESGGKLFFTAYEYASGYELWASDGSSSGTLLLADINPVQDIGEGPRELTDVDGTLFFSQYTNGYDNRELFKSDGTPAGTVLVRNIDGDAYDSSYPENLTNVGGVLYFTATTPTDGVELYKSDGTELGTVQVQDLNPAGDSYPRELTEFNGQVLFSADAGLGRQLYRSDGTTITLVADTTGVGDPSDPTELTVVGNELFFSSFGGGIPGPTSAISPTLNPSPNSNSRNSSGRAGVVHSVSTDGSGYANEGVLRTATSLSNFTTITGGAGKIGAPGVGLTHLEPGDLYLQDIDAGELQVHAWDWEISDPAGLTNIDFSGFISGNEFFRPQTDPSPEGVIFELFLNGSASATTTQIVDGNALDDFNGTRDSGNLSISNAGGPAITSATVRMTLIGSGVNGGDEALVVGAQLTATGGSSRTADRELHKTDNTFATTLVKNIVEVGPSNPSNLTDVGGTLFFTAHDPITSGRELWTSDGTEAGTTLVEDIRTGTDAYGAPLSSDPQYLTEVNGQLFFTALDDQNDRELWSSDGTEAGTDQIKNINEGSQGSNIQQVTQVGNRVFFVADDGINGEAVYVADPGAGTVSLAADLTLSNVDKISGLAAFDGGVVFFHDSLGIHHTDGTTTTAISTLNPVTLDEEGTHFVQANNRIFFVTVDPTFGEELFSFTPGGSPALVTDLNEGNSGADSSEPRELVEFNGLLYFTAHFVNAFTDSGRELIRTDGTVGGTTVVANINIDTPVMGAPIDNGSDPQHLTVSGSRLFFSADDGTLGGNGRELFSTTGVGASLASDINTGASGSNPHNLTDVQGVLYFAADDGTNGIEPFMSDGTGAGTALVANVNGGGSDSNPNHFLQVGPTVYFAATESGTGTELWKTDGTPGGTLIVEDQQPGILSSDPVPVADAGMDRVLVAATGVGTLDRELWITGGPVPDLQMALDINPGPAFGGHPRDFLPVGSDLVFVADDGFSGEELFTLEEVVPELNEVVISGGQAQRSSLETVRVEFNSLVEINGDAFLFENVSNGNAEAVDVPVVTQVNGKTFVEFTFLPGATVNANGQLLDGQYLLTIDTTMIGSFGLQMTGDNTFGDEPAVDKFFRKFGDGDGSNFVNLFDFAAFRGSFNKSEGDLGYNEAFDNDGNNIVNLFDFAAFRNNYLS